VGWGINNNNNNNNYLRPAAATRTLSREVSESSQPPPRKQLQYTKRPIAVCACPEGMPRGTAARPAVATDAAVGPGPHTAVAAGHTPGRRGGRARPCLLRRRLISVQPAPIERRDAAALRLHARIRTQNNAIVNNSSSTDPVLLLVGQSQCTPLSRRLYVQT